MDVSHCSALQSSPKKQDIWPKINILKGYTNFILRIQWMTFCQKVPKSDFQSEISMSGIIQLFWQKKWQVSNKNRKQKLIWGGSSIPTWNLVAIFPFHYVWYYLNLWYLSYLFYKKIDKFGMLIDTYNIHCVAFIFAVWPSYEIKCLCSSRRIWGREGSHSY